MKLTHMAHSCLLVEFGRTRVLIDPGTFSAFEQVTDLDGVLITHQHPDHLDPERFETLLKSNPRAQVYADPQSVQLLSDKGITAIPTQDGTEFTVADLSITGVGQQHALIHDGVPRPANVGLVLRAGQTRLFHPGDALDGEPGPVEYLAAPLMAPWAAVRETLAFVRRIAPSRGLIPIHDALLTEPGRTMYLGHLGSYGLTGEATLRDLRQAGPVDLD